MDRWAAHVTVASKVNAGVQYNVRAGDATRSGPYSNKGWCEHRPLLPHAVAQAIEVVEAMNDDLHERPVDVATFETDTAQNRALRGADAAMQVVVGHHTRQVDVIGEQSSEVLIVDPRCFAFEPGCQESIPAAAEKRIRELHFIGE